MCYLVEELAKYRDITTRGSIWALGAEGVACEIIQNQSAPLQFETASEKCEQFNSLSSCSAHINPITTVRTSQVERVVLLDRLE